MPQYYFDWFLNRLRDGYVLVRNPTKVGAIRRVPLSPDVVDGIVFWTKNPAPMLDRLPELAAYPYYVQFAINPYDNEMESALPPREERIETFLRLSEAAGAERTVWRYSPLLLSPKYTPAFHAAQFAEIAERLRGETTTCNLSFLDMYGKIREAMRTMQVEETSKGQKRLIAGELAKIAAENGIELRACCDAQLLAEGIPPARCVSAELLSQIAGKRLSVPKDAHQRPACLCAESVDVGAYDTCPNGCRYCYANHSAATARARSERHDPASPILGDGITQDDRIVDRKCRSHVDRQMTLF